MWYEVAGDGAQSERHLSRGTSTCS